jgi:hypothetical protein
MKKLLNKIRSFFTAEEIKEVPHQKVPHRDQMVPNYNEFWLALNKEIYSTYEPVKKPKRKYTKKKNS